MSGPEAIKTYKVSIPSVALGIMAWNLAHWRWHRIRIFAIPLPRKRCTSGSIDDNYYGIIDRISRGEKP